VGCVNSSGTTIWTQSFTLDPFGNLSKSGSSSFAASYLLTNGTTNNREQTVSSCVPTYDANGNMTKDCTFVTPATYSWDANANSIGLNGVGLTFDAFDREVEIASGSTHTQILYSPIGKLGTMNGQTAVTIRVPLPGGSTAELLGATASTRHILHSDWLGSARLSTLYSAQTVANDTAYAPYGEAYGGSFTDLNFTDQSEDTLSGLYDFQYREYSPVQGRWISPDPSGLSAVDPTNPQSWNRYAYVLNNPLSYTDPLGLWCVWDDGSGHDDDPSDGGASQSDCVREGGHWDQYDTITNVTQSNGIVTQINTIFDNSPNNPYGGPATTANGGAGMTLNDLDQTLQTYTQGTVPAPDLPIDPLGVIRQVGAMTSGTTKQLNCIAAAAYPIVASFTVTPEDVEGGLGLGEKGTELAVDNAAETLEGKADKLRAWHKASVPTANKANLLKGAGALLKLYGAAKAGVEGGNNFANCEKAK
jgi:RHS repeat-associated protein